MYYNLVDQMLTSCTLFMHRCDKSESDCLFYLITLYEGGGNYLHLSMIQICMFDKFAYAHFLSKRHVKWINVYYVQVSSQFNIALKTL